MGDYNAYTEVLDKLGGRASNGCMRFRNWIQSSKLIDLGFTGSRFTWSRGRCHERIDRALGNEGLLDIFDSIMVRHLPRLASDHSPILVNLIPKENVKNQGRAFRYLSTWECHEDWKPWLKNAWQKSDPFVEALTILQVKTEDWKHNIFVDIYKRKRRNFARPEGLQKHLALSPTTKIRKLELKLREELERTLTQEDVRNLRL